MMKSRFSEEKVAVAMRQAESRAAVADACRQRGVETTFYIWKNKFAHLDVGDVSRSRK
jgi:putative transposase